MKTNYIKPEMEICAIEVENMIATSTLHSNGEFDDEGGMTTGSRGCRGSWGNLWE